MTNISKKPELRGVLAPPFVEPDLERMSSSGYAQADEALHHALGEMAQQSAQELAQNHPSRLRRKVLTSLQTHWPGLTLFADHPQIPMDNNGAERAIRPGPTSLPGLLSHGRRPVALPPIQRLPVAGRLGLWRQRLVARRPGSPHWLVEYPDSKRSSHAEPQRLHRIFTYGIT
jgi:hypothetical protein